MKRTIFLPILCLMAFLASFIVISCDKTNIVEEDLNGFDVMPPESERIQGETYVPDFVQIEGIKFSLGSSGKMEDLERLAPELYKSLGVKKSNKRETITQRRILLSYSDDCDGDPETCPELGNELKGYKSGVGYLQLDASGSSDPWLFNYYDLDPKNLYNNSGGNHRYQNHNFNGAQDITAIYFVWTDITWYTPDLETWADAGRRVTWFDAKNETWAPDPVPSTDITLITYLFQTCCL